MVGGGHLDRAKLGAIPETLRKWIRQAEVDLDTRPGALPTYYAVKARTSSARAVCSGEIRDQCCIPER